MSHPIHRIPSELLAEILCQSVPLRYSTAQERRSILAPSHVCGLWRSVSLSTPSLWTFISFQCYQNNFLPREMECARAWLLRSGVRSLSIVISLVSFEFLGLVFKLLLPECMRWREIILPRSASDFSLLFQTTHSLPLLESVELGAIGCASVSSLAPLSTSPRLERLTLTIKPTFEPPVSSFPWGQLTYLNITTHLTPAFHDILRFATRVSFLQVKLRNHLPSGEQFAPTTNSSISTMHVLSTLTYGPDDTTGAMFLDRLALPSLRHLRLSALWNSVPSFISRSACSLSSLCTPMFPEVYFKELMELLPTLQNLSITLRTVRDWDMIMEVLTLTRNVSHRMPNLRSLDMRFSIANDQPLDMDCLASMIASRWGTRDGVVQSPLKHIEIFVREDMPIPLSALERLQSFVEEGLDMKIVNEDIYPRELFPCTS